MLLLPQSGEVVKDLISKKTEMWMYCDWPVSNGGHCHGTTGIAIAVGLGIKTK